jgi:hypothetical protein
MTQTRPTVLAGRRAISSVRQFKAAYSSGVVDGLFGSTTRTPARVVATPAWQDLMRALLDRHAEPVLGCCEDKAASVVDKASDVTMVRAAVMVLAVEVAMIPMPGRAAAGPALCRGIEATIVGTEGDDVLRGTAQADVIVGLGGSDTIVAGGGADVVCGGSGSDVLRGGPGNDRLYGGRDCLCGDDEPYLFGDWLAGGSGDDLLDPGLDPRRKEIDGALETLSWASAGRGVRVNLAKGTATGQGHDTLRVQSGLSVEGSAHPDFVVGTRWRDDLSPGDGGDHVWARGGDDVVDLKGPRDDRVGSQELAFGGSGSDTLYAGRGQDRLFGGPGNDDLLEFSGHEPNRFYGGPGNDWLSSWRARGSVMSGGPGAKDFLSWDGSVTTGRFVMSAGILSWVKGGVAGSLSASGFEQAYLSRGTWQV